MQNKLIRYFVLSFLWFILFYFKEGIANFIVFYLFALPVSPFSDTLWFFISIMLKISLLLVLVIFMAGIVRSFFSPEKARKALEGKSLFAGNVLAGTLGIVTPFCTCSAGSVPIAGALIKKGVPVGTALAFMMSVIRISFPELIILKKVLKLPFILTFIGIITTGIILVGYLLNFIF